MRVTFSRDLGSNRWPAMFKYDGLLAFCAFGRAVCFSWRK